MKNNMKNLVTKIQVNMRNLVFIMRIMLDTAPLFLILTIFFSFFSGMGNVAQSFFLSKIIDGLLSAEAFSVVAVYALAIIIFQLLQKLQNRTLFALNRVVTEKISIKMEERILVLADKISLSKMDEPGFLNKMEQARNLTKRTPNSIFMILFGLISLLAGSVGYVVLLGKINIVYVIIIIICSILMFIANNRYEESVMASLFAMSPERRKMEYYSKLLVGRESFEEIKAYDATKFIYNEYERNANKQMVASWSIFKRHTGFYGCAAVVAYFGCALVYLLIIRNAIYGMISIGDMTMFLTACLGFQAALTEMTDGICALPAQLEALSNYREFIDELCRSVPINKYSEIDFSMDESTPIVSVNNLSFVYPNTQRQIINGASFRINPGECVALVGVNGSGKTTLVRLLAGLYDEYQGEIEFKGIDARECNAASRSQMIAVLFQNFIKPSMTVGQAIAYAQVDEKNSEKIRKVLDKVAYQSDKLPHGMNTYLTREFEENGVMPSGGQWQKIALARMFYRKAMLYILDEPSAALDPQAEDEVFRLMNSMKGEHSILFITHRLASVSIADSVIYLSADGRTIQGTHNELMESCPEYFELYQLQAKKYLIERTSDDVGNSTN